MASHGVPAFEYLRTASRSLLQSFELSRLNQAANIREEITALIDQWVEQTAEARLARWMLDHHSSFHPAPSPSQHDHLVPHPAASILPENSREPRDGPPAPPRSVLPRPALLGRLSAKRTR